MDSQNSFWKALLLFCLILHPLVNADLSAPPSDLMEDLLIVQEINRRINDRLPVTFNNYLQAGHLIMPSARMACMGELGLGYTSTPPYQVVNARCQLFQNLEITGNYRIFRGVKDVHLSHRGFGDFADKGINFKFALVLPEDSDYKLPGIAFGMDDIIGTRAFKAQYIVVTQVFLDANLEMTLGWGSQRIRGWFGGANWMPFRCSTLPLLKNLSLTVEYDATDYKSKKHEPHPKGREVSTRINAGLKLRLWDYFDLSVSTLRGKDVSFAGSAFYNFGECDGFVPKINNTLPYCSPVITEPLNCIRTENKLIHDLLFAMRCQGFTLLESYLEYDPCGSRILRLRIVNDRYWEECQVRSRLDALLAALTPNNVDIVIVGIDDDGMIVHEYYYRMEFLRRYANHDIGKFELDLLTPLREASYPDPCRSSLIFSQPRDAFCLQLLPKTNTFFGSSTGKFKYSAGLQLDLEGYTLNDLYYQIQVGKILFNSLGNLSTMDFLNPSQLINVNTDAISYYKQEAVTLDCAYLQKSWNLGCGIFGRATVGHFDQRYGGLAGELLYYPVNSAWAIGIDGALVGKRTVKGVGFTNKIRKYVGRKSTFVNFIGSQCFLDLYYDWQEEMVDFKMSAGKFMANDYGVRWEASRYFDSGLRISFWYTMTNGHDRINGHTYYDKGFAISMPLDICYTCSSKNLWNYSLSAWLRDVGFRTFTGTRLYETIHNERMY